ncbi:RNA-dependent RNA polymerase [yado-kari virus 4b]|uniref:RNA-dependent RNA polymerase n=1 Tax=yado-kari virus 4b TaxID=3120769 RepID=A0A2Z5WAE9_9VIRU|nr:RNA-dependent RNA polymerase [Yado-kari virus 4]
MSSFCSTGGNASRSSFQKVQFKDGKSINVARNRVSNMNGKAHALHFMYDNIEPSQARVAIRRAAEKSWAEVLRRNVGINSPYDYDKDELTQFLLGKPGASKMGKLGNWDRWPKNLKHGDKWLEQWLQKNPWAKKDYLGEDYQTEPYGFSLKIDKGPDGWTEAKMKDWAHPIVGLNAKSFRIANRIVQDRYVNVLRAYMSNRDVVDSKEFLRTKNNSLGFFGNLGKNKVEVVNSPTFKTAVRQFLTRQMPAVHMAFPKPETLKISKITKKGPRMIVGAALEMELVERMATQKFALSSIEQRWQLASKIGIHNNEWNTLYKTIVDKFSLAVDYSFQDLRMPRPFSMASMSLRFTNLPPTFVYNGQTYKTSDIQKALSLGVVNSTVVGPSGQIWTRYHGIPSGMYNTAPANTTNHEILNAYIMHRCGLKPIEITRDVTHNQYGDDYLGGVMRSLAQKGLLTLDKYSRIVKELGMEFTYDSFLEYMPTTGPIPNNSVFLQRTFERMSDGTVSARFLPKRMMAKFLTCHSDIKSARQSYERALNMLNLTGNAPWEYNIIASYIKSLGYDVPNYSTIMQTHYTNGDSQVSEGRIEVVTTNTGIESSKHWLMGQKDARFLVDALGNKIHIKGDLDLTRLDRQIKIFSCHGQDIPYVSYFNSSVHSSFPSKFSMVYNYKIPYGRVTTGRKYIFETEKMQEKEKLAVKPTFHPTLQSVIRLVPRKGWYHDIEYPEGTTFLSIRKLIGITELKVSVSWHDLPYSIGRFVRKFKIGCTIDDRRFHHFDREYGYIVKVYIHVNESTVYGTVLVERLCLTTATHRFVPPISEAQLIGSFGEKFPNLIL